MHILSFHALQRGARAAIFMSFAGSLLLAAPQSHAQSAASVFSKLRGSWSGEGTIALSNGNKERVRCRGDYRLPARENLQLQLNCASDSYRFNLSGNIIAQNGTISGTWSEATRNVGGRITGRLQGNRIDARAEGPTFSALLSLGIRGRHQDVTIQSPGSEMSGIAITLSRR